MAALKIKADFGFDLAPCQGSIQPHCQSDAQITHLFLELDPQRSV
jgi:hypothetical protein